MASAALGFTRAVSAGSQTLGSLARTEVELYVFPRDSSFPLRSRRRYGGMLDLLLNPKEENVSEFDVDSAVVRELA